MKNYRLSAQVKPQEPFTPWGINQHLYVALLAGFVVGFVVVSALTSGGSTRSTFEEVLRWGITGLSLVLAIWAFTHWLDMRHGYEQLLSDGITTTGAIFDLGYKQMDLQRARYYVAYEFFVTLPDGSTRQVVCYEFNEAAYLNVNYGSQVRVRYVPTQPEICHLVEYL